MISKIEISYKTIIFTLILIITLWLLYQIKEIIFLVFVAFILMSAFKPWVDYLRRFKIPKLLSVLIIYLVVIAVVGFAGSSIIPPLIVQSTHLGESLPKYISSTFPFAKLDFQMVLQQIAPLGQNVLNITLGIFSNIIAFFTVLVISFYLIIEREHFGSHLSGLIGEKGATRVMIIIHKVEDRLGAWVRGEAALMITIGIFTFIGLTILGLPYVLPLAIIAGILEIVPTIGPIISAIPAILIALTISPILALTTGALYFIIQQLENQVIVPIVMKRVVGVPPLITLIALLIGGKLAGVTGAILAIPIVLMIETVISEYLKIKEVK